jgi:microcystin-dependent protein
MEKINIIILLLVLYLFYKVHNKQENFAATNKDVKKIVNEVYKADLESIRNLSQVSKDLQKDEGLVVPGNLDIKAWKGMIVAFNGSSIPEGWALCNGKNGTPDLRDRFIVGSGKKYNIGKKGGANVVKLNRHQMPKHNHGCSIGNNGIHNHEQDGGQVERRYGREGRGTDWFGKAHKQAKNKLTRNAGNHKHSCKIHDNGGNKAHENRPPYYALAWIMKL